MIQIKTMSWSNCFSYGKDNFIDFTKSGLSQLVGLNGHGKTSIALILEEGLYNKNSKGVKKSDILNRFVTDKHYTIEVVFEKDGLTYEVRTKRGSTQTVTLLCDGVDISSHTATSTYKQIEELLGMDHKTFVQIVIQSSSSSLEFLTATDSTRKKFLIDLLNLNRYLELGEKFKAKTKAAEQAVTSIQSAISTTEAWITKHNKTDLGYKEIKDVPKSPDDLMQKIADIKANLANISTINKRIVQNNQYKAYLDNLVVEHPGARPDTARVAILSSASATKEAESAAAKAFVTKLNALGNSCPTCLQEIDSDKIKCLVSEKDEVLAAAAAAVKAAKLEIDEIRKQEAEWNKKTKVLAEYEQYHSLYDANMDTILLDKDSLESELAELDKNVREVQQTIERIRAENASAAAHNSRVDVIKQELSELTTELAKHKHSLEIESTAASTLQVLVKAFSASGVVAYKIENLVKDLEELTNSYLTDLSGGRFQLSFKITGSDKLNVVITDNGIDIDILALSTGERARVNVSTLLGIRKMLEALSNNRINLLFLDETIEGLDIDGKEKLVEMLLKEEHLNTVLVSHGFTHPLLERISIVKANNISRIE